MSDKQPKRPWQDVNTINFPVRKFPKEDVPFSIPRQHHPLVDDPSMKTVYRPISKHLAKEIREFNKPLRKVVMEEKEDLMDDTVEEPGYLPQAIIYPKRRKYRHKNHTYKMPRIKRIYKRARRGLDRDTIELRRLALKDANLWAPGGQVQPGAIESQAFVRGQPLNLYAFGATQSTADARQLANRNKYKYKGRGDYRKWIPRIAGAAWHGLQGGFAGFGRGGIPGAISGAIESGQSGWDAGANLSKMIGWGDYGPTSTNKIIDGGSGPQQNISVNDDSMTGDIYFSHTEYIGNLVVQTPSSPASGTTTFQLQQFDLNPGLKVFPFLSQIAANFELYQWQGLIFQYKPLSGEFGASSVSNTLGKIVMATKYGVNQSNAFTSMIEMQNYDYANSTKPSCAIVHGVETDPKQGLAENLMVRTGTPDPSAPRVLYDIGKFYIATEGIPYNGANQTIVLGELWVTYRVKLSRAKLWDSIGQAISYDAFLGPTGATQLLTEGGVSSGTIGGVLQIVISQPQCIYVFPASINQGRYLLSFRVISSAGSTSIFTNASVPAAYAATTTIVGLTSAPTVAGANNTYTMINVLISVNAPNQTQAAVQINRSANDAGVYRCWVTQVDPDFSIV